MITTTSSGGVETRRVSQWLMIADSPAAQAGEVWVGADLEAQQLRLVDLGSAWSLDEDRRSPVGEESTAAICLSLPFI